MSERALRSVEALRGGGAAAPVVAEEDRAERALWLQRSEWLEALARRENAYTAGERLWRASEQWIPALAELAQDPSVLLAELPMWARFIDRHSSVTVQPAGDDAHVFWSNVPGYAPDGSECEFRLGALRALLLSCAGDEAVAVAHVECAARGGDRCRYDVLDWIPCRDRRHERALREASLLASDLEGRAALQRRLGAMALRAAPLPDLRELSAVRRFLEEVEDIILVFDRELEVLDANRSALHFSGMSLAELQGMSVQDLLTEESWQRVRALLPRLGQAGALRSVHLDARTRRGEATLEVSARVSASGESIVCIARDITGRLALERELASRNLQLREQNERIADADRMKSEFLANVSHELTTPLTSIKGFAKLLRGDVSAELHGGVRLGAEQRAEFLALVEREAARMQGLIQGLLELSNLEAGGVALGRKRVALGAVVEECVQILKPRLDDAGLALELALDPGLPLAWLDPDRVKQVVLNLLENAAKFSARGSRIDVRTRLAGTTIELGVSNPCNELEPGDLERIFARFVQRDGSYTRKYGGVGLGLNLVRAIAELHGGRAWAELREGGRVEFLVRLPVGE
ncbi:MAG TPA: HAMP domain-containing sensor histidine kinase [Myxococcota bacterium]|nr:HAMP domain-containing sensor histidine kinase [Myxococcota bacterium]